MEFKPEIEIQISNKNEGGRNQGGFKTSLEEIFLKQLYIRTERGEYTFKTDAPTKISNVFLLKILLQFLNSYLHT